MVRVNGVPTQGLVARAFGNYAGAKDLSPVGGVGLSAKSPVLDTLTLMLTLARRG